MACCGLGVCAHLWLIPSVTISMKEKGQTKIWDKVVVSGIKMNKQEE